jgi:uncharacterized membrane protein YphA (DoxX/SURF4 family)
LIEAGSRANLSPRVGISYDVHGLHAAPNHMSKIYLGHNVFGVAAVMSGIVTLAWRDLNAWQQVIPLDKVPHPQIFLYIAGAIQLLGGVAIQFPLTRRIGALSLGGIYLIFTLLSVPEIVAAPLIFNNWGGPLEQFSLVAGALVVYGAMSPNNDKSAQRLARIGYVCFAVCVVSFALEQVAYFSATVGLVPKWIPPGRVFWAIATTIAFGLAAIALFSGRFALLASRLLTIMLVGFGFLIWVPAVVSDPHKLFNWTEHNLNLAIAGAAWIVTDFLTQNRSEALPVP